MCCIVTDLCSEYRHTGVGNIIIGRHFSTYWVVQIGNTFDIWSVGGKIILIEIWSLIRVILKVYKMLCTYAVKVRWELYCTNIELYGNVFRRRGSLCNATCVPMNSINKYARDVMCVVLLMIWICVHTGDITTRPLLTLWHNSLYLQLPYYFKRSNNAMMVQLDVEWRW